MKAADEGRFGCVVVIFTIGSSERHGESARFVSLVPGWWWRVGCCEATDDAAGNTPHQHHTALLPRS